MALKQIKNQIITTKKTGQVTKAMESVSAVKMRKSQQKAFAGRPYVHAALRILSRLAQSQDGLQHPLSTQRDSGKTLLVIVTSDKGLAGSVNSSVLKHVEKLFSEQPETDVIAIGRKALEFANREDKTILSEYVNVKDDVELADVLDSTKIIMEAFEAGDYQEVKVIYQNFLSTFEQEPTMRTLLPLDPEELHHMMRGIKPKTGKFSDDVVDSSDATIDYTVEPSSEEVLDTLIPQLVQIMIYHSLLESKASEHSARMVAMKNATDKSKEVAKALTLKYNKARQAAITAEVSEITGGIEAMK
ncbi:ATP synthase F1 subunit gamma [Candidatus Pacebacteria bacterium]|nr:ATP synthase F1 subunit gamma [Candidatus Paceibacterota bacterium]